MSQQPISTAGTGAGTVQAPRPMVGFAAYSGAGKTTLLKGLIPALTRRGVRLALVKHAHHSFDIDKPGKDSYELRKAGAGQVLVTSAQRRALVMDKPEARDPRLAAELAYLDLQAVDLIVVEGFKHERFPKIELRRTGLDQPPLAESDETIIALATDAPVSGAEHLPRLDINDPEAVAAFILTRVLGWED